MASHPQTTQPIRGDTAEDLGTGAAGPPSARQLAGYFLKLGTVGFGGPVALAGFMHRDLVARYRWISEDDYTLALALAQIMPGPLAAQLAIAIGFFKRGVLGATLVALAFVIPSFLMVLGLSMLYVEYGGLWWMQSLFYAIGAGVIAIIAIAAYKLARSINKRDPLLWGIALTLALITAIAEAELAEFFLLAGLLVVVLRAPPQWLKRRLPFLSLAPWPVLLPAVRVLQIPAEATSTGLLDILLFFIKAGAFVFGSGLAIVPFLYQGAVVDHHWLTEQQFLDAVAVSMITPGPVVITVAFIGYLVAGWQGATVAAIGIFLPVYVLTVVPAPWFQRHRDNAQLKAFVQGATAAASGAIAGAVVVLGQRAIIDLPTALIALVALVVLWRFKVPEPLVIVACGIIGLLISP
ncbi:MAG: chromate transporter [Chloroflexota bacterium]|nr:chromate transporter [Chloroflexota bacterium]